MANELEITKTLEINLMWFMHDLWFYVEIKNQYFNDGISTIICYKYIQETPKKLDEVHIIQSLATLWDNWRFKANSRC